MNHFSPIDAHVVLRTSGVYSEHQLFVDKEDLVYARKGNGYIRLLDHQATTKPGIFWDNLTMSKKAPALFVTSYGRMSITPKAVPLRQKKVA